jgi:hypothetical protein
MTKNELIKLVREEISEEEKIAKARKPICHAYQVMYGKFGQTKFPGAYPYIYQVLERWPDHPWCVEYRTLPRLPDREMYREHIRAPGRIRTISRLTGLHVLLAELRGRMAVRVLGDLTYRIEVSKELHAKIADGVLAELLTVNSSSVYSLVATWRHLKPKHSSV